MKAGAAVAVLLLAVVTLPFGETARHSRRLNTVHTHATGWPGSGSLPHIRQRVAVVNPYFFCWEILFGTGACTEFGQAQ